MASTGSKVSVGKDGRAWRVEIGVNLVREYTEGEFVLERMELPEMDGGKKGGLKEGGTSRDSWG